MICPNCGYDNPNGQKYCRGCDVDLSQAFRTYQHYYKSEQKQKNMDKQARKHSHSYSHSYSTNYNYATAHANNYSNNQHQPPRQQYYRQPNYAYQSYHTETDLPCSGMGTSSLVLGIIGLVLCWVPGVGFLLGTLSLIFGAVSVGKARSVNRTNGRGVGGLICSCINLCTNLFVITSAVLGSASLYSYFF